MSLPLLPDHAPARLVEPPVRLLASLGVTPNMVSVAGLSGNAVAAVLIARGDLLAGGIVMLLASALDALDGALARSTEQATAFGAVLDATLDRLSEAAVLFGLLWYELDAGNSEESLLVFVAMVGSMLVSYVRARAEANGISLRAGLFTRPERVVLLAAALITGWLRPALWTLAVLTMLTALQRLILVARRAGDEQP